MRIVSPKATVSGPSAAEYELWYREKDERDGNNNKGNSPENMYKQVESIHRKPGSRPA